jgi:signal transduction histidine kinase
VRALRLGIFPLAVALGLFAEWAALRRGPLQAPASPAETRLAVMDLVVGTILAGCGIVAIERRPESRTGLLLALTALTWFLGTFAASGDSAYADFGSAFLTLHRGPLAHALLSYPSGRLEGRLERAGVALAYALSVVPGVGRTAGATIAVAAIVVVVALGRYAAAAGPERRARATAAVASAAFATALVAAALERIVGGDAAADHAVLWAYDLVVGGVAVALTLDLLLRRWVRATVAGVVVDLGESSEAGTLRDRLASAVGDRSLVLGYRLPHRDVYVDDEGRAIELPRDGAERRVTLVRDGNEPVAALVHDAGVLTDPELLDSVSAAARIAVGNARLQAEIRRRAEEIEASRRRLIETRDAERRRLERELREGAEAQLAEVEALLRGAEVGASGTFARTLAETQAQLAQARAELREFARGIHPRALTERGLAAALDDLAERSPVPVELSVPASRYPPAVEATAYFVCSEALANVAKHAEASGVAIEVSERRSRLAVSIADDGRGGATMIAGSGLRGLADRLDAIGGRLSMSSTRDRGTTVVAEVPLRMTSLRRRGARART